MKKLFNLIFCALFVSLCSISYAQSAKKTVILVNGQPTEVMLLPDGSIQEESRVVPNHMAGYVTPPANLQRSKTQNPILSEIPSTAVANEGNVVTFSDDAVALNESSMKTLESMISKINDAPKGFVLLRSSFNKGNSTSDIIVQKRVNACKKYLELRGIAPNKILISLEPSTATSNDVSVFIR